MMFISPVMPAIKILGRIFQIQNDRVALGFGVRGRLDGGNLRAELSGPKGIDLEARLPFPLSLRPRLLRQLLRAHNFFATKS